MTEAEKQQILDEVLALHGCITHEAAQNIADYIERKFSLEPNQVQADPLPKE